MIIASTLKLVTYYRALLRNYKLHQLNIDVHIVQVRASGKSGSRLRVRAQLYVPDSILNAFMNVPEGV